MKVCGARAVCASFHSPMTRSATRIAPEDAKIAAFVVVLLLGVAAWSFASVQRTPMVQCTGPWEYTGPSRSLPDERPEVCRVNSTTYGIRWLAFPLLSGTLFEYDYVHGDCGADRAPGSSIIEFATCG